MKRPAHPILIGDHVFTANRVTRRPNQGVEVEVRVRGADLHTLRRLASDQAGSSYRQTRFVDRFDAADVRVTILDETTIRGVSTVVLKLDPVRTSFPGMRVNLAGEPPAVTAERQLRHLLLGETPDRSPLSSWWSWSTLPQELQSGIWPLALKGAGNPAAALPLATLLAIYHIRSLNLVDEITRLTFSRTPSGTVKATFAGTLNPDHGRTPMQISVRGSVET